MNLSSEYSQDEALRITAISAMIEGQLYRFRVHNSGGKFMVMLKEHVVKLPAVPGRGGEEICPHTTDSEMLDPCSAEARSYHLSDIKEALHKSIAEHNKRFHYLKQVK